MRYEGNICPNCFDTGYNNGECPKCGYRDLYNRGSTRALPSGVILNRRYILGKVLGEGGFGITYKACDLRAGNVCAIKEYAPAGASARLADGITLSMVTQAGAAYYEKGLRRFMEEAQILRRLGDIPAVVHITDCFKENQTAYFAMEYLEGANLNQIIRVSRHQLPFDEVTGIITQVGMAMDKIHREAKILHRDISPENIYVTKENKVKLIDFGSAKESELQQGQEYSVVLKLKFAPPEQHSSRMRQGPYTDVYSLAGTYYYALTGHNLPSAVDRLTGEGYVPLKQMNMGIPDYVSDAVDQALELDCQARIQTMKEFVDRITNHRIQQREERPVSINARVLPYLEVAAGQMIGARWNLPANMELKVGRSQRECHVRISGHPEISKVHCMVFYNEIKEMFYIRDVSTNGTYVNGKRIGKNQIYPVRPSSSIALSGPSCVIRLGIDMVEMKE